MTGARDRLLNFLLGWALLTAALPTLIVYRAALQPRYQWGLFGIAGQGVTLGLLFVAAAALLAWAAVVLGSLRTRPAGPLLVALNTLWFGFIVVGALRLGSQMTFRGDAWGVRINLAVVGPLLFGALLLLSIRWWWTRRAPSVVAVAFPLSRTRQVLFGAAVTLLPAIVVLFAVGDGVHHTWADRLAVLCVIAQSVFIGAALRDVPAGSARTSIDPAAQR